VTLGVRRRRSKRTGAQSLRLLAFLGDPMAAFDAAGRPSTRWRSWPRPGSVPAGRRDAQLANLVAVLDRARAVYRAVADHARAVRNGSLWGLVDGAGVLSGSRRIRWGTRSLGMAETLLPAGRGRRGRLVAPSGATCPLVLEPAMGR
jgi:hypothetical protein